MRSTIAQRLGADRKAASQRNSLLGWGSHDG
jgi:hypothetical protein